MSSSQLVTYLLTPSLTPPPASPPKAATSWLWECMHVAFVPEMICPRQQHKQPRHAISGMLSRAAQLDAPSQEAAAESGLRWPPTARGALTPACMHGGPRRDAWSAEQSRSRLGAAVPPRSLSEAPPTTPALTSVCYRLWQGGEGFVAAA